MTAIIAATTIATTRNVSAELYVAAIFDIGQCTATTPQYSFSEENQQKVMLSVQLSADGALQIEGFGGFEKDASASDMDASDTGDADADVSALAGMWYMDGDVNAASWIELDGSGIWTLYERSAEGDWSEVDYGTLRANGDNQYEAVSDAYEDVSYDLYLADDNAMYWGGENDYYQRT